MRKIPDAFASGFISFYTIRTGIERALRKQFVAQMSKCCDEKALLGIAIFGASKSLFWIWLFPASPTKQVVHADTIVICQYDQRFCRDTSLPIFVVGVTDLCAVEYCGKLLLC